MTVSEATNRIDPNQDYLTVAMSTGVVQAYKGSAIIQDLQQDPPKAGETYYLVPLDEAHRFSF